MEVKLTLTKQSAIGALVGATIVGSVSGYFLKKKSKTEKETIKKVDAAIKSLADMTEVEVSKDVIDKAAHEAALRASNACIKEVLNEMNKEIKSSVKKAYSEAENDILPKIKEEVSKSENVEKAINMAADKAAVKAYNDILKKMTAYNDSAFKTVIKNAKESGACATLIL